MRDVVLFVLIMTPVPFALRRPAIGTLAWVWLSLMNPHRLAWGFAYSFPFASVIACATIIGLFLTKEPLKIKGGAATAALLAFVLWTAVTTVFALVPSQAQPMLERMLKIQFFTFIALSTLYKREHVQALVWTIVLSIGYYAIKGGIFTIATAGNYRVWGPAETFISDNNALALATVMTIPLWGYLYSTAKASWMHGGIVGAGVLSATSVLGSYSRGALLALSTMAALIWLRSRHKLITGVIFVSVGAALVGFLPDSWEARMSTVRTYESDDSAQQRLHTWATLFALALDRPIIGGGFEPYSREVFDRYSPEPFEGVFAAHSIYFQVLAEHGFVGLGLFGALWFLTWRVGSRVARFSRGNADLAWASRLARNTQASLAGYFIGGAFLNLGYWDMPYYLMVLLVVTAHAIGLDAARSADQRMTIAPTPTRSSTRPSAQP